MRILEIGTKQKQQSLSETEKRVRRILDDGVTSKENSFWWVLHE